MFASEEKVFRFQSSGSFLGAIFEATKCLLAFGTLIRTIF